MFVHTLLAFWAISTAQSALTCVEFAGVVEMLKRIGATRASVSPQREETRHTWSKALMFPSFRLILHISRKLT